MEDRKDFFFDKRDTNYICLDSPFYFFEMFVRKKIKSDILIPQTVIFVKGNPKLWLFNSKKSRQILKKNQDKLNLTEIGRVVCNVRNSEDYRIDSLTTLLEVVKQQDQAQNIAFVRFQGELKRGMNKVDLVKNLLETKDKVIASIHDYVPNNSRANEIYYTEYRQDDSNLPVNYRFFKKSVTLRKQEHKILKQKDDLNPFLDLLSSDSQYQQKPKTKVKDPKALDQVTAIFKFFDQVLNNKFSMISKQLVYFVEKAYRIRVKKMVVKFMIDDKQSVYFLGLKELYIEIPANAPYDIQRMKEELRDSSNCSFENFQVLCKMYLKRQNGKKEFKMPQTIYEDEKEISQKLYKKLIIERCTGDFCEFLMTEKNRGPLAIRKNLIDDYKKHFGTKKLNEENFSITLPFEISFQLILRTRECADEIIELLRKNKIYSKHSYLQTTNDELIQDFDADVEYPFRQFKTEVYNMGNLYKNVKICKNCFVVYSLTSKYFDQRLKGDLKTTKWRAQTTIEISRPKFLEKLPQTAPVNTFGRANESLHHEPLEEQKLEQLQKGVYDQLLVTNRNTKSASQDQKFRILKKSETKMFRLYMPPKDNQIKRPFTSQQNLQIQRKNLDATRMAMGFLNYEDKKLRPSTEHQKKSNTVQSQMQQCILNKTKPQQVRSKQALISDSKSIQDFQNDKLQIRKKCINDIDFRQKLKDYYQTKVVVQNNPCHYIGSSSIYSYHSNFQHLRQITKSLNSTPMYPILDQRDENWLSEVTLQQVCNMASTEYPPKSIAEHHLHSINYFVYDQNTAIPYLILVSTNISAKQNDSGVLTQGSNQVIMFSGDFFDNSFEYIPIFENILNDVSNTVIILFNTPGQAYTIFDENQNYDNLVLCDLVDKLLCELDQRLIVSTGADSFKFIGIGYSGYFWQTFLCFAVSNIPFVQGVLLINTFAQLDDMLKDTLLKSIEVFSTCPTDMQELPYNYYSVIANSKQLTEYDVFQKMQINPISIQGRNTVLKGCLNSYSTWQQFQLLPIYVEIYHTLKNCIVNLSQTDILEVYKEEGAKEQREKLIVKRKSKVRTERKIQFINGGHQLIDENPELLASIFDLFIKKDQVIERNDNQPD